MSADQLSDDVRWLLLEMQKLLEEAIVAVGNADLTRPERNKLVSKYTRMLAILQTRIQ